jgi:L-lactate dehydrogenase complex protein LldF
MTRKFREKIRSSLTNPGLQAALDANAERRRIARRQAYASLPEDLEELRQRAHAVRSQTIVNLDQHLSQFIANAQANGFIVHRAANSAQAVQIVRQISREIEARLVVKSKSMVSEEIHLNSALEEDGIRVVETDLGEYIIQLRGEPPAHIITPAVHLVRREVGQTFQDKLGIPFSDDIPTLTQAARRLLRQDFLTADIGISGVNFGVVENGALCLLTNEGNGRMVTTLPDVHIALMGIERLVCTLEDLALMLYLLPRSATGQKLTVYTNLVYGPRRIGEIDGPRQRHIVLVDNGRSSLRASPLSDALFCIRCGACLNACPVFQEIGGHAYVGVHGTITPYPGPIGAVVSPGLFGVDEFGPLARASSLCGACKEACPVDIDLPQLFLRLRAAEASPKSPPGSPAPPGRQALYAPGGMRMALRLFTWVSTSPFRFRTLQRLAGILSRMVSPLTNWLRLPAFTGWGYGREFPRPALRPFRDLFPKIQNRTFSLPATSASPPPIATAHSSSEKPRWQVFETELTALGGVFIRCQEHQVARCVSDLLGDLDADAIQAWDEKHLPHGLIEKLRAEGVRIMHEPDPALKVGLTGALAGVAESGTIVLHTGSGRPLTASLLPEFHVAILRERKIYSNLFQVLSLEEMQQSSYLTLISGPSRTADIEMTLTIGVHGPRQLYVICVE